ncbi:MAG TPA: hypothetical protein H9800_02265, partial [Candidatus Microbacterium stercoravium]|nr:hypothetical protein [Candidatus Microbacterium stercoravium]
PSATKLSPPGQLLYLITVILAVQSDTPKLPKQPGHPTDKPIKATNHKLTRCRPEPALEATSS